MAKESLDAIIAGLRQIYAEATDQDFNQVRSDTSVGDPVSPVFFGRAATAYRMNIGLMITPQTTIFNLAQWIHDHQQ